MFYRNVLCVKKSLNAYQKITKNFRKVTSLIHDYMWKTFIAADEHLVIRSFCHYSNQPIVYVFKKEKHSRSRSVSTKKVSYLFISINSNRDVKALILANDYLIIKIVLWLFLLILI